MFKSYWYVCHSCDASIEIVSKGIHFQDPSCNCSDPSVVWCQTNVVESDPTETEGNKMEETTDTYGATVTPAVPESYNANLLVTYKVIRGYSDPEYATEKVASLEWDLHNGRERQKENSLLHSKIDAVKEIISEAYADSQDQDTLRAIAEALNIELTKTIEFTATIEVTGTIDIDLLSEWDNDFDSEIEENLYVDSQAGNIEISEQYVTNVREA